ncbi:MAG: glycine--tRNA ligase subunit beta [Candidatus Pelagibacter sp. TMED128]|nr:MAG: glycine--tRNA ligase subunit beta [Candidatus Pelagibacter sp. TMED128]|tara:strand:+ start:3487 stop:5541 length:2055 start_codon:yes stop_codon:yes gene_type:complete
MSEFLLELYSEEIPPQLQINARTQLKQLLEKSLREQGIPHKECLEYSSPTRLTIYIKNLPENIKIKTKEVKGPKVGVPTNVLEGFSKSNNVSSKDLFKKETDKGEFYFIKIPEKNLLVEDLLINILPKVISSINWKKSMKWSINSMMWGRPLRSIFAIFNCKKLTFKYQHLESTDNVIIEQDLITKSKKIKNFKEYFSFLKSNEIILDQNLRKKIILQKFNSISKLKNYKEQYNERLLEEVVNIVENPHILLVDFDKEYLKIPEEIIISTLEKHQRYFPIFDNRERLTNYFFVIANKKDKKKIITEGNKRVVDARLTDAKFFWEKDRSKNLIKQIANLKTITFYEKIGSIYDKTQRIRNLAGLLSDELNINKEKVQVAASISKSDLCSDLVGEYPELQGVMGKYFALAQGFEEDVANSISEHYLPTGLTSALPKKPFSYSISIVDKLDSLVGFFLINEKPTSSKDPFALRRSAIGLLRIIIENKLSIKLRDLISYSIRLYEDQGVEIKNKETEIEVLDFLKERMRNILKLKNIKIDIIEASITSHVGDNFLDLYKKNVLMNKYINKDVGINVISSYKRASNITDKAEKRITGRPDAVLFRTEEEKVLFEKINEIRKAFTVKESNKDYENLLIRLSETKQFTDNFFDNVVVNDENQDIKNNRLELLKMFCNTFNNFINFSKLEGL